MDNSTDARPRSQKNPRQRGNRDGLTLDDGRLVEQPANREDGERGPAAGEDIANGDRGQVSRRMQELDAQVSGKPGQEPDPEGI
jgi:hypothetical protein